MEQEQRQQIERILTIIIKRKEFIAICLLIAMAAGLAKYLTTPKSFQSSALIRYQQQSINPSKLSPDVKTRLKEMVSTVTKQVTSRSSLENLIKKHNLYTGMRARLPMEDVVAAMRNNSIKVKKEGGDIFRVSYKGGDPKVVMQITNALAAKFIEENQRFREERASQTSAYVKDELRMSKMSLDRKEVVMRDYKLKYYNEMPDQQQINMSMLTNLQNQHQSVQENIQDLERTKIMVREQINLRQELLSQERNNIAQLAMLSGARTGLGQTAPQISPALEELSLARKELTSLLNRYTASHPNVKRLQRTIKGMEESYLQSQSEAPAQTAATTPAPETAAQSANPTPLADRQVEQLNRQLADISYNISKLKKEQQEIKAKIASYQKWVEAAPVREAEWAALTRDYNQLNSHYQELVSRNLEAESAENLERRQKGSQFKIVDTAHFPEKPCNPDFLKIMAMAIAIGLGLGGSISFGLALLDNSVNDMAGLDKYQLPVICTIPPVLSKIEQRRQRTAAILWGSGLAVSTLAVAGVMAYMYKTGNIII